MIAQALLAAPLLALALAGCSALARRPGWDAVTVGWGHACALRGGQLYCWGDNDSGALGSGARRDHRYPVFGVHYRRYPTKVAGRGWTQITAADESTCGIRRGRLRCWGDGLLLENLLGDEREVFRHPVRIGDHRDWQMFSLSDEGSCGLRANGALFCANELHVAGAPSDVLFPLGRATGWSVVVAGPDRFGGILHGRLWLWYDPIVEIAGERPWQDLALGEEHACGIQAGGALYCWGDNRFGQLGDGSQETHESPQRIGDTVGWTDIAASEHQTCGIRDGAVYCWGVLATRLHEDFSDFPPHRFTSTPQRVDPRRDWTAIAMSPDAMCGLRDGGRLACRELPSFRVDASGQPLDPDEAEAPPWSPPGARRFGF